MAIQQQNKEIVQLMLPFTDAGSPQPFFQQIVNHELESVLGAEHNLKNTKIPNVILNTIMEYLTPSSQLQFLLE